MMQYKLMIILFLVLNFYLKAQEDTTPEQDSLGNWDLLEDIKKTKIAKLLRQSGSKILTSEGAFLKIEKDGKVGYYDWASEINVLEPIYDSIVHCNFYSNVFKIYKNNKIGLFYEVTKKVALEPIYDGIEESQIYGYYIFQQNQKYGLYSIHSGQASPCEYDEIHPDKNRGHEGTLNGKKGVLTDSFFFIDMSYYNDIRLEYGTTTYRYCVKKAGKWGVLESNGKIFLPIVYDVLRQTWTGYYWIAQKNKKFGLLDNEGNTLIPHAYKSLERIDESDFFIVQNQKYYGVVNLKNEVIVKMDYSQLSGKASKKTAQAFLVAQRKNKYGVINLKEEIIVDYQYNNIEPLWYYEGDAWQALLKEKFFEKVPLWYYEGDACLGFAAKKGKKWGALNLQNKEIVPFNYLYVTSGDGYMLQAEYGANAYKYYDYKGKLFDYEYVMSLRDIDGTVVALGVKKGEQWGVLDLDGKLILPIEYGMPGVNGVGGGVYIYVYDNDNNALEFNLKGERIN